MNIFSEAAELLKNNHSFVLVTITDVKGSAPGKPGFKMLVHSNGATSGTVGGGAIEKHVIEEALKRLSTSESGSRKYILSDKAPKSDDAIIIPMSCNGGLTVYYDVQGNRPTVYLFGGGHVGQALLHYMKPLDYHTILIDNRPDFAHHDKNPNANEIICADYKTYAESFDPAAGSYIVILTHGHKFDETILNILYKRKLTFSYIGIIASESKAAGILKRLRENDADITDFSVIHSPIGLKIGGTSPAEIALAVAAEIQSVKHQKVRLIK